MDIPKAVTVEAPIASGKALIVRDTLAVATAIIHGKPRFTESRNTPPTVRAASFS
ncbi:MAG: hypothetical protein M3P18_05550 [Actinomycetota bacterium]|nr:hypothetical protein [Actinomycetota bacterium]